MDSLSHARKLEKSPMSDGNNLKGRQQGDIKKTTCFHGFELSRNPEKMPVFDFKGMLGCGAFGVVRKAICARGCELAVKKVCSSFKYVLEEKRNLEYLGDNEHHNIIKYFGCYLQDNNYHFVMEVGDIYLPSYLVENGRKITLGQFNNIIYQGLDALLHLANIELYHGEFSFKSMLWTSSTDKLKVIDFGLSKLKTDDGYCDPISDLEFFGWDLAQLQLDMKFNVASLKKGDEWFNAQRHFFNDKYDALISSKEIWSDELDDMSRQAVAVACSTTPALQDIERIKNSLTEKHRFIEHV